MVNDPEIFLACQLLAFARTVWAPLRLGSITTFIA